MKKLIAKIREILRNRRVRKLWTRTVSSIACLVVFVTTYALVLPAITMESQASCGIEAHQHDDSCYEERLTCTIPEADGHTHTEDCYSTKQKLICDRSEHEHNSDCYDENGNLTCSLEEHQHGRECFEENRELVCGLEEAEGHHHDSSCYEKVLTCGKEAHTHSQACYREDAASEMKTERAAVAATTVASEGGNAAADANGADGSSDAFGTLDPAQTDSEGFVPASDEASLQQPLNSDAAISNDSPAVDETTGSGNSDAEITSDDSSSAEENITEAVEETHPAVSFEDTLTVYTGSLGSDITGSLSSDTNAGNPGNDAAVSPDTDTAAGTLPASSNLTVSVSAEAGTFPAGTTMVLSAVTDMDAVAEALEGTVDSKTRGFQAVDISFRDKDGNEIEPLKPISVTMRSDSIKAATEDFSMAPVVVHVEDRNKETTGATDSPAATVIEILPDTAENKENSETPDVANSPDAISFEADAFSVYAIVYTVDFEYSVNGKMYQFSLPGGGFVSFTDLVEVLGIIGDTNSEENGSESGAVIAENAEENAANIEVKENGVNSDTNSLLTLRDVEVSEATKKFVADVVSVEFSSPELVDVSKVENETTVGQIKESRGLECQYSTELMEEQIEEINAQTVEAGDWALISLQPFDTEETLTITTKNGDQFVIKVTDASYQAFKTADLDHKTVALVNLRNNNALQDTPNATAGRLNAVAISYNSSTNMVQTTDPNQSITKWTFEKVNGYNDRYYISSPNGYLNLSNNGSLSVSSNRQEFQVSQNNDGTIRIRTTGNNPYAVNNWANTTANGYTGYQNGGNNNQGEWFTAFLLDTIALSPMNENGILPGSGFNNNITSTHYKNMTIDGYTIDNNNDANLERSRMYIPVQYNNDGTATITLPSNDQLGSFSVSSADSVTHSITQDPNKYQWKLHGWVNIATGVYYDVTNGPVSVAVSRDNLNVFYADWWAADYNYTIPEAQRADTVDTSSFVNIKMWDYNEMYNLRNSTAYKPDGDAGHHTPRNSIESEEWYIDGGSVFQFVDNTDSGNCWQYGSLGNTQWRNRYNPNWSLYDGTGILNILGTQGQVPSTGVLESLFPASVTPGSGVNYLGQGNYLFSYNETTKTYSYDSNYNGAVYNQSEGKFYVSTSPRDNHWRGGGGGYREDKGFFPLNDATSRIEYNNGTTNNWFGMSIDLDFWLPDAPGSSTDANKLAGHNMRFDFTGDDDVWVLIDGKLALDIGGIHEAVSGYIDFSTGKIRNAKGNEYDLSAMGIGAGAHTLSFYYLERGGNASNCKITFNIVPRWDDEPERYGEARVTKTWSDDTPEDAKQSLTFSLQTSDGTPVEGTEVVYTDGTVTGNIWRYEWEGLDPDQDYKVVEGEDPYFLVSSESEVTEIKNCWAAASYHKNQAFGSNTILLGNNRTSAAGGKLLNGNGGSDNADFVDHIVKSTVTDNEKWTVEGYDSKNQHFYLKNPSGSYLSIKNGRFALVNNASDASLFYMSPSGDLNDANSHWRLKVNEDGSIGVGAIVNSADETGTNSPDRIHIYRFFEGNFAMRKDYNFVNKYILLDLDVLKVEKGKETSTMLPGAVFELRKLEDVAPTNLGGTLTYVKDNNQQVVVTSETTGDDGRLTFSNLTYGVYEIREVTPPPGYILAEDVTFYLKVEGGVITYVQKGSNKPSEWTAASNSDGATVYFMEAQAANPDSTPPTASANATFRVGNTPGVALPNTGGPGTRLFTILGSILILGAGVLLWRRRRLI